jgi:hypothetical protein
MPLASSRATLACLGLLLAGVVSREPALAHRLSPELMIVQLESAATRGAYGVVDARRSAELPRLLMIAVDDGWAAIDPETRRVVAERWRRLWRESVSQGVVAVVDAASGESLVSFDAVGRARLKPARGTRDRSD